MAWESWDDGALTPSDEERLVRLWDRAANELTVPGDALWDLIFAESSDPPGGKRQRRKPTRNSRKRRNRRRRRKL